MLFNEAMTHKFKLDTFLLSCSNLLFFLIYDLYFGILSLKYFIPYDYKDCIYLIFFLLLTLISASPMAQWVKNPLAIQETQKMRVQFLSQEDPLEEEMATHSSILT